LIDSHNLVTTERNKVYLVPIGKFISGVSPNIEILREYCKSYLGLETYLLPEISLTNNSSNFYTCTIAANQDVNITHRKNPYTKNTQLLTTDIHMLLQKLIPNDAYCLLALTMIDLYPKDEWNFVFGQAMLTKRVGVFSFARYDPNFATNNSGKELSEDNYHLLLRRSLKVMSHEIIHMFGVHHCIYYACLMQGSNHLMEADGRPMHLCPIDLHKLKQQVGFSFSKRYEDLLNFFSKNKGFEKEVEWITQLLLKCKD